MSDVATVAARYGCTLESGGGKHNWRFTAHRDQLGLHSGALSQHGHSNVGVHGLEPAAGPLPSTRLLMDLGPSSMHTRSIFFPAGRDGEAADALRLPRSHLGRGCARERVGLNRPGVSGGHRDGSGEVHRASQRSHVHHSRQSGASASRSSTTPASRCRMPGRHGAFSKSCARARVLGCWLL